MNSTDDDATDTADYRGLQQDIIKIETADVRSIFSSRFHEQYNTGSNDVFRGSP